MLPFCKWGDMEMPKNSFSSSSEPVPFTLLSGKKKRKADFSKFS